MLENGLELQLEGDVASKPYIEMTIGLMQQFGAKVAWNGQQKITVQPTLYRPIKEFIVEPDWSAASYWYEMMALSRHPNAHITLVGLTPQSLQGDQRVCQLLSELGVETTFNEIGATLLYQPTNHQDAAWEIDFSDCPDLAQTFVVTCALLGKKFRFSGLSSLRIKETDRNQDLQNELKSEKSKFAKAFLDSTVKKTGKENKDSARKPATVNSIWG
jgi:3-phosphoshikimate 1-carboxyvinyltransferase